jgi:hypothetical protein
VRVDFRDVISPKRFVLGFGSAAVETLSALIVAIVLLLLQRRRSN